MFNQLSQQEQSHPEPPELQVSLNLKGRQEPQWLDVEPLKKKQKKITKKTPLPALQQQSDPALLLLGRQLQTSKRRLKRGLDNHIKQEMERIQYQVFVSETTNTKQDYLKALYQHTSPNKYIKQQINDTIHDAAMHIEKDRDFKVKNRKVPRNKGELHELEKADHYRLLKIKEGQVKSKVGNLRNQLEAEYFKNKIRDKINAEDILQDNYYSIDHPRTKEAHTFVMDLQERRKEQKKQYELYLTYKKQEKQYEKQRDGQAKQMQRMERRTKLKQYYQSKLQQRLVEKQHQNQKKEEFKEWMRQYQRQKPLQIQKEEQFRMKILIPELEERHKKLMTIKAEHKPIDPEQLQEHQLKYLDFKKDDHIRKKAELEMIVEQNDMRDNDLNERMFKGKYRYLVLEQMLQQKYPIDNRQIQQSKKDRIKAYNEHIRQYQKHLKDDENHTGKQIEQQTIGNKKFMRRVRNMNGSLTLSNRNGLASSANHDDKEKDIKSERNQRKHSEQFDQRQQGNKNLAFLKSMIREQVTKQSDNKPNIHFIEQKQLERPKGFLQQQREKRVKGNMDAAISKQIQQTDVTANEEIDAVKAKADILDQRLKRKEMKLKNNKDDSTRFEHGEEVEKDYVQAIKAKINLLNKFD